MPAWLVPALKAVLPHVGTILSAAAPVLTKRRTDSSASQASTLQQQIDELQAATLQHDAQIKEMAGQIRTTLEALEHGEALAERRYRRILAVSLASAVVATVSMGLVLTLLLR
ncbi:hypothetical protein YTPLAS18_11120 [Nitrospira sp.]|nr:hypothetical protein YTPLAS18_11120 [Nitrospira sp.]